MRRGSETRIRVQLGARERRAFSSKGIHYGNTIALSGIMERRGRGHAGDCQELRDVEVFLFSWIDAVLLKNPASDTL